MSRLATLVATLAGAVMLAASAAAVQAQDTFCEPGDTEVRTLRFEGNRSFSDEALANGLVTEPSGLLRRTLGIAGSRRCLDEQQFRLDVARLTVFYRRSGFFAVEVDTVVTRRTPTVVDIAFRITEGPAIRLDTLGVAGLEGVSNAARVAADLGIAAGDRFNQYKLDTAQIILERRLRNQGYPQAQVLKSFETDTTARLARAELQAAPGPLARVADIQVEVTPRPGHAPQMRAATVRRLLGVADSSQYSERALVEGQRALYLTDAFERVDVQLDSSAARGYSDALLGVIVRVAEAPMRTVRAGAGYGTLDCFRAQAEYTDVNFLGGARRLELNARVSKIGIGSPLDVSPGLCFKQIREDVYSDTLNYYVGATFRQPALLGLRTPPTITLYSERRSDFKAYLRTTPAAISLTRGWTNGLGAGIPITGTYSLEYGRTEAQPAFFCAVFNLCTDEDRQRVQRNQRLAVLAVGAERARTDDPVDPGRGSVLRFDVRHSSSVIGSEPGQGFNQLLGSAAAYVTLVGDVVLAGRLRVGGVLGPAFQTRSEDFVPPQERLYGGGPNSVRGFRQNELGPVVYLARGFVAVDTVLATGAAQTFLRAEPATEFDRAVPTGGNMAVLGNLELRFPSPVLSEILQLTTFVDVGEVWNRGQSSLNLSFSQLKWTPGAGIRARSPVGPIRVDVGYNPYRLPRGVAYFDEALTGNVAPLYCVSPGNTIPSTVVDLVDGRPVYEQATGARCPASFIPQAGQGFFRRLAFHFSIGQAF